MNMEKVVSLGKHKTDHTDSNGNSEQNQEKPRTLHHKSDIDTNDREYEGILPSGRHLQTGEKLIVATI